MSALECERAYGWNDSKNRVMSFLVGQYEGCILPLTRKLLRNKTEIEINLQKNHNFTSHMSHNLYYAFSQVTTFKIRNKNRSLAWQKFLKIEL